MGGYNAFYIDPGTEVHAIDGKIRNLIIYEPADGRAAIANAGGAMKCSKSTSFMHDNDGTASWLSSRGDGPFDGPETLLFLSVVCLVLTEPRQRCRVFIITIRESSKLKIM